MERSETIDKLAAALCLAQSEFGEAAKTKTNPHLKSKYADLGDVWDAAKDSLTRNELSVAQVFVPSDSGFLALETVLLHSSGQYISGIITMPLQKPDPQGYGAAATYARRYALSAILGICADDDDDGHSASQVNRPAPSRQEVNRGAPPTRQQEKIERNVAAVEAGRPGESPALCPSCHAPAGKPHAKTCAADEKTGE